MKIINLIENLDDTYGGPAKSVPYMCKYLEDINVEAEMVSIKYHDNERNSVIGSYKLKWKSFKYDFIKKIRYSSSFKSYLNDEFVNNSKVILHVHNLWNYVPYVANMISEKYNIPLVLSIRGSLYDWSLSQGRFQKKIAWRLFQKTTLQNAACIHVTEIKEMEAVRSLNITTPVAIIPNGVNFDEFKTIKNKSNSKKNLGLRQEKKYILFMSRIHPKKGLEYLVNSWAKVAHNFEDVDLLIVGPQYDEKYIKNIKHHIQQCDLQDRVTFTGMLQGQDRIDAFGSSDLFVLPSYTENFGIAIAEAMVAKLPVITTHGTPWKEIEANDAGWWVELTQDNIDNALYMALSLDKKKLAEKGINGFELIKKYEWKYQASKMKEVYEWISYDRVKPEFIYEYRGKSF